MTSHYLLQDWLQWAQGLTAFWQGGGWQALRDASGNFNGARDVGNVATGAGSGAAATRDGFRRLTGLDTPANEAPDGFHRIRDVFGSWINDLIGGGGGGPTPGSGTETRPPQPAPREHFPLEDFLPGGSGGQGPTPAPADVRLEDLLPDDMRLDPANNPN